jgi:alpha-D-ribose 1-methylphosphonate 5-triphosphate diphosphatase PhnM
MATSMKTDATIRIGVFDDVDAAERAVTGLIQAGFRREQISVLCSDETKEQRFRLFEHEDPAGSHTAAAAAAGSLMGGVCGGLVSAGISTAAGLSLLAAGPSFLVGGAVLGGFIGAMQTRGQEGSLADFYDQSLSQGKLLVAAQVDGPGQQERFQQAEHIFREAGAIPFPLPNNWPPVAPVAVLGAFAVDSFAMATIASSGHDS